MILIYVKVIYKTLEVVQWKVWSQILKKRIKASIEIFLSSITLTVISLIGYSAMDAGGLGDVAIRKGYQGYNFTYLAITSIILIVIVQSIQSLGNYLFKKLS